MGSAKGVRWIMFTESAIHRIDPDSNSVAATIGSPGSASFRGSSAWIVGEALYIASADDGHELYRIDTESNTLDAVIELGPAAPTPEHIVVSGDTLWFGGPDGVGRLPLDALGLPEGRG